MALALFVTLSNLAMENRSVFHTEAINTQDESLFKDIWRYQQQTNLVKIRRYPLIIQGDTTLYIPRFLLVYFKYIEQTLTTKTMHFVFQHNNTIP